jgi:hypothetical protein
MGRVNRYGFFLFVIVRTAFVWVESHQPVTFQSCGSINVFLETITIFLGFDSFVDDAVVGEQSQLAGFQIFW